MRPLKTLLPLARRYAVELIVGFAFMLLQNYGFMKFPVAMKTALDEITGPNRVPLIVSSLGFLILYTAITVVSMFLMRKLIIGVSRKIEYELRGQIYHKLLAVNMTFFQQNQTGDLASRCTNDLDRVRMLLGPGVMYLPNSFSRLILFFPILFALSPSLMAIMMVMLGLIVVLILLTMPRLRPLFKRVQEYLGSMNNRVWQVISGISTIKLYALEPIETQRFQQLNEEYVRSQLAIAKTRGVLWPFFIFVFSLTELIILWIGGQQVIQQQMTLGELLQFNVMIAHLTFPVLSLGWVMTMIQEGVAAMARINYILEYPVETRADWQTVDTDELEFSIRNLSFDYPVNPAPPAILPPPVGRVVTAAPLASARPRPEKRGPVLNDITLTIGPKQVVGLTGTIGSGKTTLISILSGLYKPEPGMVFVNGMDICNIQPTSLFAKISVVPQETFLFSRTIAENIALGLDGRLDLAQVQLAARHAGLEEEILTFPDGYQQIIGERGITLSGGQKQRTAIARALLKQSPMMIFDDALSNVDAKTEAHILENLASLHSFSTLIIISHRISALKNADTIYVLDDGHIVEHGSHAELLEQGGLYAKLAKMQKMQTELGD